LAPPHDVLTGAGPAWLQCHGSPMTPPERAQPSGIQTVESFLNASLEGEEQAAGVTASQDSMSKQVTSERSTGSEFYRPMGTGKTVATFHLTSPEGDVDELDPSSGITLPYKMLFDYIDECLIDPINPISEDRAEDLKSAVETLSRQDNNSEVRLLDGMSASCTATTAAASFLSGTLGLKVGHEKTIGAMKDEEKDKNWRGSSQVTIAVDAEKYARYLLTDCFDCLEFRAECSKVGNRAELKVLTHMFSSPYQVMNWYSIQPKILVSWLEDIRGKYLDMPYHNWGHAISVAQFCYNCIVSEGGEYFNKQDILAVIVAALAHDVAHPGLNADHLIRTEHSLAIRYNDRSPLENMHAYECYQSLRKHDFLAEAANFGHDTFRAKVLEAILATDMASHMQFQSRFSTRMPQLVADGKLLKDTKDSREKQELSKPDRRMFLEAFLKMGDQSGNATPFYLQWKAVVRLEEECFRQGDREKELGIPVAKMFDREKDSMAMGQDFFLGALVKPLLVPFRYLISNRLGHTLVSNLDNNRDKWKEYIAKYGEKSAQDLDPLIKAEEHPPHIIIEEGEECDSLLAAEESVT